MFCPWSRPWERKMESVQLSLLVLGLVLVLSVQTGYSSDDVDPSQVMCHVCNSAPKYEGADCDNILEAGDKYLRNCSEIGHERGVTFRYCRKMAQNVDGDVRIVRQCATKGRIGECIDRTGTKGIKIKYCECTGHGCNTANQMFNVNMLLLALSSALLALICHS